MADLKDILNEADDPKNDELLKYLEGGLTPEQRHQVERQITDSDFVGDAVEGLQSIRSRKSIEDYVDELNRQLHKQVTTKKQRKDKRRLKDNPWVVVAVVLVLGLCIIGYAVIRYYQKQAPPPMEQRDNQ